MNIHLRIVGGLETREVTPQKDATDNMSGPELQDELTRHEMKIPVIFITAQKDEAVRLRMLARGAVDCLFKPFSDTSLQRALDAALLFN